MALKEIYARFGIAVDDTGLKKLDAGVTGLAGKLQAFGAALAGGAIVGGLRSMINATSAAGAEINDSALRLGFATDELQTWRYAAKLAGVSAEGLEGSIQKLNLAADNARQGSKPQVAAFKALGVSFKDAQGNARSTAELLPEIADGLAKIEDPAKQSGLAVDLLGRSGVKLLPLLKEGSAGLEKYKAELEGLGGIMSGEAIAQADEYGDNIDRLDFAMGGLRNTLVLQVLPAVTSMVDKVSKAVAWTSKLVEKTNILKIAGSALAGAAAVWAIKLGVANAGTLALAGGITAVILAVEDMYTLMTGGKSIVGDFLAEFTGDPEAPSRVVEALNESVESLVDNLRIAYAVAEGVFGLLAGESSEEAGKGVGALRQEMEARKKLADVRAGGRADDKVDPDKKLSAAVQAGDSAAFQAAGGSFDAFKERRLEAINAGKAPVTEKDLGTFGSKVSAKAFNDTVRAQMAPGKAGNTVNGGAVTVNVNVPSGTSREQALAIGKIARQEMERANRAARAALRVEAQ